MKPLVPASTRAIYLNLYGACKPYTLPGLWRFRVGDRNVLTPPADPERWLGALAQTYRPQQLIQAGVAHLSCAGRLEPVPALYGTRPLIFQLHDIDDDPYILAIIGFEGCLHATRPLPLVTSTYEVQVQSTLRNSDKQLFVAASVEDVAVLRALHFPATLGAGLADVPLGQLPQLMEFFKWKFASEGISRGALPSDPSVAKTAGDADGQAPAPPAPGQAAPGSPSARPAEPSFQPPAAARGGPFPSPFAPPPPPPPPAGAAGRTAAPPPQQNDKPAARTKARPPELMLLDWSPAHFSLEKSPLIEACVVRLRHLEKTLDFQKLEVGKWAPPAEFVATLAARLEVDPQYFSRLAFVENMQDNAIYALEGPEIGASGLPPDSVPAALAAFRTALGYDGGSNAPTMCRRAAVAKYLDILERDLIEPLYRPMARARERNLQLVAQQLSRLIHTSMPITDEVLRRGAVTSSQIFGEIMPGVQIDQIIQLTRMLLSVNKAMR